MSDCIWFRNWVPAVSGRFLLSFRSDMSLRGAIGQCGEGGSVGWR